ncbi:MAG TPA: ATP-binding cassette domain-containing protein [Bryobacteraceae bacterium]|jgi:phospholipid/cholesterol/gamma-HCH transport system ATP-binding protein|nr:ATP-binding cassette domain-containing protein [Bryobacteraceae bacterium]
MGSANIDAVTGHRNGDAKGPAIAIRDLRKSFGEQKVLNGITLDVQPAETVVVLGRSGTGKSVLLKLLIGLQKADCGSIQIHGENVTGFDTKRWNEIRKKIGFLFQQAALYDSLTVQDNVAFPLARHTELSLEDRRKKARELLKSVGMEKDVEKMPSEISGGMQKRVGLARALALDPDILLFDEPTAGLDPITAAEIGQLILELQKDRKITSVVVTHDVQGAKSFADRMVLMRDGKVVQEGRFEDFEKSNDEFVQHFFKGEAEEPSRSELRR